jgi:hypothetical protein
MRRQSVPTGWRRCDQAFNRVRLTIANPKHACVTQAEMRLLEKVESVVGG